MAKQPADKALLSALSTLVTALRQAKTPFMVIGGIAVIARGVPRQTIDIDATVWAPDLDVKAFAAMLAHHGITGRIPDLIAFARENQILLLRHEPTETPLEISLAWLPFEEEALRRAGVVSFGGVDVPVAVPDDLIVYKAVAWRDRDRADIERLLVLHRAAVDLERIRGQVAAFARALEEPERLGQFDALVRRALEGTA